MMTGEQEGPYMGMETQGSTCIHFYLSHVYHPHTFIVKVECSIEVDEQCLFYHCVNVYVTIMCTFSFIVNECCIIVGCPYVSFMLPAGAADEK